MILMNRLRETENYTYAEQEIMNFILENPKLVTEVTIEKLAELTYSSPSSIVRLCKKLGMKGYADFKIKLASEINTFETSGVRIRVDIPFGPRADKKEVANTLLNLHYQALMDTYNTIDLDYLQKVADVMRTADCVLLLGYGESLLIAEDFHLKLRRLGISVFCEPLVGYTNIYPKNKMKNQVALIVSHYADRVEARDWLREFRELNIKTVLLCANKNSPLLKMPDYLIMLDNEEDRTEKMGSFASRTAMGYVLDVLYGMIFMMDYQRNVKYLYEQAIRVKKRKTYILD